MPAWWSRKSGRKEGAWWERSPASKHQPPPYRPPSRREQRATEKRETLGRSLWMILVADTGSLSERHEPFSVDYAWSQVLANTPGQLRRPSRSQVEDALWDLVRRERLEPYLDQATREWLFVVKEGWWKP